MTFRQLIIARESSGVRVVGRSEGVSLATEERALRLAVHAATSTPDAVEIIVAPDADKQTRLLCVVRDSHIRVLVMPKSMAVNPFHLAASVPAVLERGPLNEIVAPSPIDEPRPIGPVAEMLKTGDSPLLLGAAQVLLDGGRFAITPDEAKPDFILKVWDLLPWSSRDELTFATYAQSPAIDVDAAVVATAVAEPGFFVAEALRCYPNGRYEQALLLAAEMGDQAEFDKLLRRKTGRQTMRLAVGIILFAFVVVILLKLL